MAILFAFLAAFFWATSTVFVRLGLRHMSSTVGTLFSLAVSFLMVFSLALLLDFRAFFELPAVAFFWFAILGTIQFLLGRLLNFTGVSMAGATRVAPVIASSPLFAAFFAVVFTNERLTWVVVLGTVAIVLGLMLIVSERRIVETTANQ